MTQTAAAHIVLASAHMGQPEVIVMTRDEGMGAQEIERLSIPADYADNIAEAVHGLTFSSWRTVGELTQVRDGYYVVDVERS